MYAKRYSDETIYQVIEYYQGGARVIPQDQHDYLEWIALGNIPTIEANGRFLSVVDGILVVDPNKDSILAAEEAARVAEAARIAAKEQALVDNLPSWTQVQAAVGNIANLADAKAYLLKLSRVVYWLAKDKAD
jgi:hypothetical protein